MKHKVLPQRNQFGMIVIVDDDGEVVKTVKSSDAAAKWIIKEESAMSKLAEYVGFTREEVESMSIKDLKSKIYSKLS